MLTTAESIAAAIAEERPQEAFWAPWLADEIAAAAEARGIPLHAAIAFVHDRPRVILSGPEFLRWCERFKIIPAAELGSDERKESST
jgi:hypothetical protein